MIDLAITCIVTADLRRLRDFYARVLRTEPQGNDDYVEFRFRRGTLALFDVRANDRMAKGSMEAAANRSVMLEFEVDDVDAEAARLAAVVPEWLKPPTTQPWGSRSVWFRDPEGNAVNLFSRPGPRSLKTLAAEYFDRLLNRRDLTVCDELLAPDYVDGDAPADTPPGGYVADTKAYVARFLDDHPDLSITIEHVMEEADTVALRLLWRGTHKVSGQPLDRRGMVFLRFDDRRRIARRWSLYGPA